MRKGQAWATIGRSPPQGVVGSAQLIPRSLSPRLEFKPPWQWHPGTQAPQVSAPTTSTASAPSSAAHNVVLWKLPLRLDSIALLVTSWRIRTDLSQSASSSSTPSQSFLKIDSSLENFLVNLSPASYDPAFGSGADASIKAKIIHLIASVRTIMRMPLIFVNSVIILYELVLG
ncbi:uncharacterized protein NECHADRAFT_74534 [Fusarium vanettenii 77-13-4]|uniref:Yos1-like protein n=1 Tax=Fusarium vanettenii (strain ATCC MYA-4622 / CBS 123669 / FGSC 9596 / NRRL 45880 / 77-13-4) TaxID=660122 RepID=C7YK99_FUSV7|nr:uncharacterized protein NECHADRAFT_74534 [Fusarium vanettenii 77-13-4]EEU47704.1 hypothetical protein NECHADRAFT_74534 [Fusarium vanettenii 77-13-4]